MRDRYEHDNVEFDLPTENICQELCEEIDALREENKRLREALEYSRHLEFGCMDDLGICKQFVALREAALAAEKPAEGRGT
jgi:hypothetical protein